MKFQELGDLVKGASAFQQALDENIIMSVTNEKGIIVYANRKFCDVSQYSEAELVGQNHNIISSGYHDKHFFKSLWSTITAGEMWHGEIRNKAKDNSYYWVDTVIVPVMEGPNIKNFISLRTLITGKKEAEIALTSAIYNLSHLIRQPLVNMQSLLTICREGNTLSNEQEMLSAHMQTELEKIDQLTRKIIGDLHVYKMKINR